ncbi:MAG: hypothetical protein IPP15_07060 [Saprospiraceae bacterium]|uniref:Uncharacterized protein n=1 Tax=Candidatus Opimibacter skivensis TaxID=2982028 RepID=A0A9D7SSB4_9BACT|nr:hypothetical protein [Candidatus Opimibacter skivensis]
MTGKDMGAISGIDATGILISDKISDIKDVNVAILATVSDLPRIGPQLLSLIEAGLSVVTTCEEMFFPWDSSKDWSETIDRAAKDKM